MVEIDHPWLLLLTLPAALFLWHAQRRSIAALTPANHRLCCILRSLALLAIILALAGIHLRTTGRALAVMFVVDHSASIPEPARTAAAAWIEKALQARRPTDAAGVVAFAGSPALWVPPSAQPRPRVDPPAIQQPADTDIGRALDFAAGLLPAETHRRIVLISDGHDTAGTAEEAAQRLAASGIEVHTVPVAATESPEVVVERVDVPRQLKSGEPFDLKASIHSSASMGAKVKIYQNQFLIDQRDIQLEPGSNPIEAPALRADGTFVTYEVEVIPEADTLLENNRAQAAASLRGEPRVLIIDPDPERIRPLADVLRREKIHVETRRENGAPRSIEDLQQFDLLVLSDLSALALHREQMELYRRWVQDFGGGFAMLGGEQSYGVGGYYRTPIEQMLPVRMEHQDRQDVPSVALLVVLDRSGSMSAQVQGQTKMSLANQGAVFALNVLQPRDYFGVLAVDVRAHTVAPLAQHASKDAIAQKIMSVTAGGGGIYIYTSLVEAFALLRDAPARIKHVILFSDAADAEEKTGGEMGDGSRGAGSALDLASAMLTARITTSVVALGLESDRDTAFLRQLAERGNGRFYLTSDATTLPQIFSTETMKVAQSSLIEEPFQAVPARPSPLLGGIDWPQAPLLLGYNSTKLKPTADLLLATERGEPLLATWRYGLGQSAAFTSDAKARWASEWLTWPGYGRFWAQLIRATMRKSDRASFAIATHERGGTLAIELDALKPDGSFHNALELSIHALLPDGSSAALSPSQTAPGRYTADFTLPALGTTVFSIHSPDLPDGGSTFAHTRSYPREYLHTGADHTRLAHLAAAGRGAFDPATETLWTTPTTPAPQRRDLTDWFLIAALALIPLDIWVRRR
jgi:uncharacterized membrane protein